MPTPARPEAAESRLEEPACEPTPGGRLSAPLSDATSEGHLLGGRISYRQPIKGYRTALEPVLLAASIPARPGDRVIEAGTGAGAGLLCLATRVPGLTGLGVERDAAMAALASSNLAANGLTGITILSQDLSHWMPDGAYDHAFANPPWHPDSGTPSPIAGRRSAKIAGKADLAVWVARLAAGLRRRGTLSLVVPASALGNAMAALSGAGCPEISLIPLWPRAGQAAKLIIMRGVRGGGGGCALEQGLVLHEAVGNGYTRAAEAVLRGAATLS